MLPEFKDKFRISELIVHQYAYWTVSVRPVQITVGSLVLSLNRHAPSLGLITPDEAQELQHVFSSTEQMLEAAFSPAKVNYLALMLVDSHVHLHVIPRYEVPTVIANQSYDDHDWPAPPRFDISRDNLATPEDVRDVLLRHLH